MSNHLRLFKYHIRWSWKQWQLSDISKRASNGKWLISFSHQWSWWWSCLWSYSFSCRKSWTILKPKKKWRICSYQDSEVTWTWVRWFQNSWAVELRNPRQALKLRKPRRGIELNYFSEQCTSFNKIENFKKVQKRFHSFLLSNLFHTKTFKFFPPATLLLCKKKALIFSHWQFEYKFILKWTKVKLECVNKNLWLSGKQKER